MLAVVQEVRRLQHRQRERPRMVERVQGDMLTVVRVGRAPPAPLQRIRRDQLRAEAERHIPDGRVIIPDLPDRPLEDLSGQVRAHQRHVGGHPEDPGGPERHAGLPVAVQDVDLAGAVAVDVDLAAEILDLVVATVAAGSDDHGARRRRAERDPAEDMLEDRLPADLQEHLAGEPGRAHPGLDDRAERHADTRW